MTPLARILSGFALSIAVAGCTTRPPPEATAPALPPSEEEVPQAAPAPAALIPEDTDYEYRLGPGDVIELFATSTPEINRTYVLGPDGRVSVPGIGDVDLTDKTRSEAARVISGRLDHDYRDPRVTVLVDEYNNNRIYVLGEVRKPGEFNFAGRPTLLGALSRAQGLTDGADLRACTVVRGKGILFEVNLYDLLEKGNRSLNLTLHPEDIVYVSANEENLFYVLGEVRSPGVFALGEKMDSVRALAAAGGPTEDGILSEVRLIRPGDEGAEVITMDFARVLNGRSNALGTSIRAGDIVYVPRRGVASFNYVLRQITPSLNVLLLGDALSEIGQD